MKDEEMADKYAEEYFGKKTELVEVWKLKSCKDNFLAGLKAGRQWHKVADGDLPKHNHEVLCLMWSRTKEIGYYENEVWHFENFVADYEDVDYWQEIVLPKESK